jgi:leader peptidase (prepilin peptidase)/N-methyltransferase
MMPPIDPNLFPLIGFLFGMMVGSFLNVCIYRLPLRESIVFPASHCTACGKEIRWYQNVPVVSWLLLRGRCASCGERISIVYPFVELLTGRSSRYTSSCSISTGCSRRGSSSRAA